MNEEEISEWQCPFCRGWVATEYMNFKTRFIGIGRENVLVCVPCADEYEENVVQAMQNRMNRRTAQEMGITVEALKELREESQYYAKEDIEKADDEVDVMDADKAKRIFRDKSDPHEQGKSPIQIMQERFARGIAKSREKRIIVPVKNRIKSFLNKG